MKETKKFKLPNLDFYFFQKVPRNNLLLKEYLHFAIPDLLQIFHFNSYKRNLMDISEYWGPIKNLAGKIRKELVLYNFTINNDQLADILATYKKKEIIGLKKCNLITNHPLNFGNSLNGF
mmetsp:Transcript_29536/g.26119  ORF Transcript_29536/g.26119 Transcript_29536/m.26119 type:complete len:120 (-) Transcript_29536:264-623(-)